MIAFKDTEQKNFVILHYAVMYFPKSINIPLWGLDPQVYFFFKKISSFYVQFSFCVLLMALWDFMVFKLTFNLQV